MPFINKALNHNVLDHADSSIVVMLITAEFVQDIPIKSGHGDMPALRTAFCLICAGKFRIGLQAAFAQVNAFIFVLGVHADSDSVFDRRPNHEAGEKYPEENG